MPKSREIKVNNIMHLEVASILSSYGNSSVLVVPTSLKILGEMVQNKYVNQYNWLFTSTGIPQFVQFRLPQFLIYRGLQFYPIFLRFITTK